MTSAIFTRCLSFAAPVLALLGAPAVAQHFPADEDVELMLRYLVEDGETPGIVVAFMEADGSTRILSYGSAGPDARPLESRSIFEIGSINKTFTGVLLAEAIARGEATLDDPVSKFLPDRVTVPSLNGREITLLDLTTHTSGLPRLPDNHEPEDMQNPYADFTVEELYEFLSSHELRRDPGSEWEYSNLAVGLLGHALARASGMSYVDLVRARITDPLGMEMTAYPLDGAVGEWMTRGHSDGEVVPYWFATESIQGAGGLRSNVEDMLLYLKANLGPPESDLERSMRVAQIPRRQGGGEGSQFGFGWAIRESPSGMILAHGGGTGGFSTYIGYNRDLGVGAIRLTNTTGFGDDIASDFVVRGPPLDIPEVDVDETTLAALVGEYEVGGNPMWVRLEDEGFLTVQVPGNVRFKLYAESDTSFFVKRAPWRYWFLKEADGGIQVRADVNGSDRSGAWMGRETPEPRVAAGNPDRDRLTDEEIARYAGTYALSVGGQTRDMTIFGEEGQLMAQPQGQGPEAMFRTGDNEFSLRSRADIQLVFEVEGGMAVSLSFDQGGRTFAGPRRP